MRQQDQYHPDVGERSDRAGWHLGDNLRSYGTAKAGFSQRIQWRVIKTCEKMYNIDRQNLESRFYLLFYCRKNLYIIENCLF